jgi:hypothetical protein
MALLTRHFSEISIDQFLKLSNFILEKLFQSSQFQVENEDVLFNLVADLIGRDSKRKILLKLIYFPSVSTEHIVNFFSNFPADEIDSDLFESIKTRLFCDIFQPNSLPPSRWRSPPAFRSKEEIDKIFQLLQDYFQETSNPVELIKTLLRENEKMKNQLKNVKNEKED